MKKNIYLTVLSVITIICMIVGCLRIIGKLGSNWFHWDSYSGSTDDQELGTDANAQELEAFTNIDLDVNVLDVTIVYGDQYTIAYDCDKRYIPQYQVKDDTLYVKQSSSTNWNLFSLDNAKCEMTITLPKDTQLDNLNMQVDVGDVKINGIKATSTTMDADVGDVDIDNANMGDADFSMSTGDISLDQVTFTNLKINASVGDVEISTTTSLAGYRMDLSTSVGEIEINGQDYDDDYENAGTGAGDVTVNNSTGDIEVKYPIS